MATALLLSQLSTWPWGAELLGRGMLRTVCDSLSSSIALGALLGVALHHAAIGETLLRVLRCPGMSAASVLTAGACLVGESSHLWFPATLTWLVGACVAAPDALLVKCLSRPWLTWIGKRSYGLYLTHFVAIGAVRVVAEGLQPVLTFGLALPLALVLANVVFESLELPLLSLKRRYERAVVYSPRRITQTRTTQASSGTA